MMYIKGFDKDLCCRGMQFEVGKTYETGYPKEKLECCSETVIHFCDNLQSVNRYYSVLEMNRFCEVEPLGDIVKDDDKYGTNKIKIVREIVGEELSELKGLKRGNTGIFNTGDCNTGSRNTGDCNTGDWNTGNRNTGDCNTGSRNTGNRNTGDCNTGSRNTGNRNTGDCNTGSRNTGDCNTGSRNTGDCNTGSRNTGDCNTGDWNTGNRNTGDWNTGNWNTGNWNTGSRNTGDCNTGLFNSCNRSTGVFNTKERTITIFNKDSGMTWNEFYNSEYFYAINSSGFNLTEWIDYTEEEMKDSPIRQCIRGYLKEYTFEEACKNWWDSLSSECKELIKTMPNFDKEIFKQITGIEVEK